VTLISKPTGRYYIQLLEANCHGMTTVMIEWAGKLVLAVFSRSDSKSGSSSAVSFITITAMALSKFRNAVVNSLSAVVELTIRFAPGRTNFEKWPR
jgi:hypothetical protein